jgi:ORF6N domain
VKIQEQVIADEIVIGKIVVIRGQKVMLDYDLAELYGVKTKVLKQAVRRNLKRFPVDFMFELSQKEFEVLRSQIVTSNSGGMRYMPMAFTEHGVLMLSSVLRSDRAIEMNIQIMRIFTKMKEMLLTHKDLLLKVEQIESKITGQDEKIRLLFDYLNKFLEGNDKKRRRIGYQVE